MKTEVIHTTRKVESILLFFFLILNYSVGSIYSHTNSYNNAVTQCHVDGAHRAWGTCGPELKNFKKIKMKKTQNGIKQTRNGIRNLRNKKK